MTIIQKILLVWAAVQCLEADGNPVFQGLSFQKDYEFILKPMTFLKHPITFLKETWSPFGLFGTKISVHKRSLDDTPKSQLEDNIPAAPVFEDTEDEPIGTAPLNIVARAPVYTQLPRVPPPQLAFDQLLPEALPSPMPIIVTDYPPPSLISNKVPPISTNLVIITPPNGEIISVTERYTDISRVESVEKYLETIQYSSSEPPLIIDVASDEESPPAVPEPDALPPIIITPVPVLPPQITEQPLIDIVSHPEITITEIPIIPIVTEALPPPVPSLPPIEPSPPLLPPPPPLPPPPLPPTPPIELEHPVSVPPVVESPILPVLDPIKEEPPNTEIIRKDSTLVRGSKMALKFGSVFLTLMAQFFEKARDTIDFMTNPNLNLE